MKSLFTKDQKREVKANFKNSLKNNFEHQRQRFELVNYLVKQELPNWNVKVTLFK